MTRTITLDPGARKVWEANLAILHSSQPSLSARLEAWAAEQGHLFEHIESKTENGIWIHGLTRDSFFQSDAFPPLPWKNQREAEGSVLFVYGTGAVPWLYTLLRSLPEGPVSILVMEPSTELLAYTLHTTAVFSLLPRGCRLAFVSSVQEMELREALRWGIMDMGTYVVSRLAAYCHPGETALWDTEFGKLQTAIRSRLVIKLQQLGNSMEDTLLGLRQMALMAPWITLGPRLDSIKNDYRGRPFIWVASGPSLDKNFHLLKENRDRAVVVCADTAASKLLGNSILPHIVVALERGRAVHEYLEKLCIRFPDETKKILLVAQAVCVPEVAGKWPGPVVVVGKSELSLDRRLVCDILGGDVLVSGLSVAHMGIWLAAFLGASRIALIGQDLAFAPQGTSHAADTVSAETARAEESGELRILKDTIRVPGAYGGMVETHEIWRLFLDMMEEYVPIIGCPLFDCTEGGALIRGTTVMPFQEWLAQTLSDVKPFDVPPAGAMLSCLPAFPDRQAKASAAILKLKEELQELPETLEALHRLDKEVERVGMPALSPERRRRLAESVYRDLDVFHEKYPAMDFIGQGFSAVNAARLAQNRHLNDVSSVKIWMEVFGDLIAAYRISIRCLDTWLRYASFAIRSITERWEEGYSLAPRNVDCRQPGGMKEIPFLPPFEETLKEPETFVPLADNLLARADHEEWRFCDPEADRNTARFLARCGRFSEAAFFMERFERTRIQENDLPEEELHGFYAEYARILLSRDLCAEIDWKKLDAISRKLRGAKDVVDEIARRREADLRCRKATMESAEGKLFFDYVPKYVAEELSRLVTDVTRLMATAFYNKIRVLDFSPPEDYPTHR